MPNLKTVIIKKWKFWSLYPDLCSLIIWWSVWEVFLVLWLSDEQEGLFEIDLKQQLIEMIESVKSLIIALDFNMFVVDL